MKYRIIRDPNPRYASIPFQVERWDERTQLWAFKDGFSSEEAARKGVELLMEPAAAVTVIAEFDTEAA